MGVEVDLSPSLSEGAIGFPLAEDCRNHPLLQQHDEVPLWRPLILRLHCPHHPAGSLISIFECINLSDEVTSQEIDVLIREAVPVAVVISTSRLTGIWRNVRCVESSVEVFLALSHGQAELAHISWPVGVRSVGNVVAGGVQVRTPTGQLMWA